jgi:hypothetical protein
VEICITAYLWRKERGHLDTLLEFTNSIDQRIADPVGSPLEMESIVLDMLNL